MIQNLAPSGLTLARSSFTIQPASNPWEARGWTKYMISIENISKSFGAQVVFDQVDFKINPREKLGLVGRNGHGKTTFFRLLTGQERADEGRISVPSNYRIGYVRQEIEFSQKTVLEECMTGLVAEERHTG